MWGSVLKTAIRIKVSLFWYRSAHFCCVSIIVVDLTGSTDLADCHSILFHSFSAVDEWKKKKTAKKKYEKITTGTMRSALKQLRWFAVWIKLCWWCWMKRDDSTWRGHWERWTWHSPTAYLNSTKSTPTTRTLHHHPPPTLQLFRATLKHPTQGTDLFLHRSATNLNRRNITVMDVMNRSLSTGNMMSMWAKLCSQLWCIM